MSNVTLSLLSAYATCAKDRLVRNTKNVFASQEHFLLDLLHHHQQTIVGRSLGLESIKTIDQFCDRVPIWSYEQYEPYTNRIAAGEKDVLNPESVMYINLTSGSTGNKKQVPVTRKFQASLRHAELASLGFMLENLKQPEQSLGKQLITNSAMLQGITSGGIEYGPVTAGRIRQGKCLFEQMFAMPYAALQISDILSRHYICLLFALRNVHLWGIVGNFPMLILRTCSYLEQYAEELMYDLECGTIAAWLKLDADQRAHLERRWSASPGRAVELRDVWKSEGKLTPKLAWQTLSLVTTAQGGTSSFYLERFPEYFDDTPVFGGVYGTAEGNFSVYPAFNSEGGILAIESGFFEFIPQDQWDVAQPKTLLSTDVEAGQYYRILVTSYSGFYRYDIGDVVEVVGFYNQAPLIVFRHRRGGLLSSTTEKTTEFHVTQVMQILQQEFNVILEDFCVTLSNGEFPARYVVNIELAPDHSLDHPHAFLKQFEYWMGEVNQPYGTVRASQVPSPQLRILAPGSFVKVRQRQVERGIPDSQLKIPHISEDRQFLAGLSVQQEVELLSKTTPRSDVIHTDAPKL